jgi:hypothetical protein
MVWLTHPVSGSLYLHTQTLSLVDSISTMKLWCLLLLLLYWQKLALIRPVILACQKERKKHGGLLESANLPPQQEVLIFARQKGAGE